MDFIDYLDKTRAFFFVFWKDRICQYPFQANPRRRPSACHLSRFLFVVYFFFFCQSCALVSHYGISGKQHHQAFPQMEKEKKKKKKKKERLWNQITHNALYQAGMHLIKLSEEAPPPLLIQRYYSRSMLVKQTSEEPWSSKLLSLILVQCFISTDTMTYTFK